MVQSKFEGLGALEIESEGARHRKDPYNLSGVYIIVLEILRFKVWSSVDTKGRKAMEFKVQTREHVHVSSNASFSQESWWIGQSPITMEVVVLFI